MGAGIRLMMVLEHKFHVGYCNYCREWTAFTEAVRGAFICPMCGNFGSPRYGK